jgi:hypothetical protein
MRMVLVLRNQKGYLQSGLPIFFKKELVDILTGDTNDVILL